MISIMHQSRRAALEMLDRSDPIVFHQSGQSKEGTCTVLSTVSRTTVLHSCLTAQTGMGFETLLQAFPALQTRSITRVCISNNCPDLKTISRVPIAMQMLKINGMESQLAEQWQCLLTPRSFRQSQGYCPNGGSWTLPESQTKYAKYSQVVLQKN